MDPFTPFDCLERRQASPRRGSFPSVLWLTEDVAGVRKTYDTPCVNAPDVLLTRNCWTAWQPTSPSTSPRPRLAWRSSPLRMPPTG